SPARSGTRSPGRAFWGQTLLEKHLVDLARNRELSLKLANPAFRRGKLQLLISVQTGQLPAIDALLLDPAIDRGLGHPKRCAQLRNASATPSKLNDLTTYIRRVPPRHLNPLVTEKDSRNQTPPNPGRSADEGVGAHRGRRAL